MQYGMARMGAALLVLIMTFSASTKLAAAAEYDFQLEREVGAVKIFKALDREQGYQRVRVQTVSDHPLEVLLHLNTDVKGWAGWMPKVLQADYVEPGTDRYIAHTRFSSPWPVKNRDSVIESKVTRNPDSGVVRLAFRTVEDRVPPSADYVRIPYVDGFWEFTPLPSGQVGVVYEILINPGGNVPKWMVNFEAVDLPLQTVLKVIEQAAQHKASRAG